MPRISLVCVIVATIFYVISLVPESVICEAYATVPSGSNIEDSACKEDNTTDTVCSNRGKCFGGQCICDKRNDPKEVISGQFCECDNYMCGRHERLICGGEDHGTCVCGFCFCESEWEGETCNSRRNKVQKSNVSTETKPIMDCNPLPNPENAQYIVGYGSLIKHESKIITVPNSWNAIPALIKGFSREWNAQTSTVHSSCTYLGVLENANSSFNGVVFKLRTDIQDTNNNISSFDELINIFNRLDAREEYYCRHKVPSEDVILLSPDDSAISGVDQSNLTTVQGKDYWIYVNRPEFTNSPNENYPIVQSYVDIFISGCIQIREKFKLSNFTDDCIKSTKGWNIGKWVNDRIYPRRSFLFQPKSYQIDNALSKNVPEAYRHIQFEG